MAPRPYWKGYLRVALVNCPVTLSPVGSDRNKIRFHTLDRATGDRVESRYVDSGTGAPVAAEDEVKGYPTGEDTFVQLEDAELAAVALESTRTIDIACFVPRPSIGWIWLDQPHFMAPGDKVGAEAFAVIREAMTATGTVGVSRLVLQHRERAVMLEPRGKGILLWTLRYGDEVRAGAEIFAEAEGAKPEAKALATMKKIIGAGETPWSPDLVKDPVEARLAEMVAAKKKAAAKKPAGRGRAKAKAAKAGDAEPGKVVSIFEALRRGVEAEKKR